MRTECSTKRRSQSLPQRQAPGSSEFCRPDRRVLPVSGTIRTGPSGSFCSPAPPDCLIEGEDAPRVLRPAPISKSPCIDGTASNGRTRINPRSGSLFILSHKASLVALIFETCPPLSCSTLEQNAAGCRRREKRRARAPDRDRRKSPPHRRKTAAKMPGFISSDGPIPTAAVSSASATSVARWKL